MTLPRPPATFAPGLASRGQHSECPRFPALRVPLRSSVVTAALESLGLRNFPGTETSQRALSGGRLCGVEWGDLTDPAGFPLATPGVRSPVGGGMSQSEGRSARRPARERGSTLAPRQGKDGRTCARHPGGRVVRSLGAGCRAAEAQDTQPVHGEPIFQMGEPRFRKGKRHVQGPLSQVRGIPKRAFTEHLLCPRPVPDALKRHHRDNRDDGDAAHHGQQAFSA